MTRSENIPFVVAALALVLMTAGIVYLVFSSSSDSSAPRGVVAQPSPSATATTTVVSALGTPVRPPAAPVSGLLVSVTSVSRFNWPAEGRLTSYFGSGHTLGIDIGLGAGDSPIRASADGVVAFAGGDTCCEYGLHVVISHDGGFETVYAHLSQVDVREGDVLSQGDVIGLGGSTGIVSGKHLHFELHDGGTVVDPLRYLPSVQRATSALKQTSGCGTQVVRIDPASSVYIDFTGNGVPYRVVDFSLDPSTWGEDDAAVDATNDDGRGIIIDIPSAFVADGLPANFVLGATVNSNTDQQTIECQLMLMTGITLANTENTGEMLRAAALGSAVIEGTPTATPTATHTPTRTPRVPTETPTRIPTRTPVNATPRPATPVPTFAPGQRPATPRPAPTLRPPATPIR